MRANQINKRTHTPTAMFFILSALASYCFTAAARADSVMWKLEDHLSSINKELTGEYRQTPENGLSFHTAAGEKYNVLQFNPNLSVTTNLMMRFNVRRISEDSEAVSFALAFTAGSGKSFYISRTITAEWNAFDCDFSTVKNEKGDRLLPGERISDVRLYTRNPQQQAGLNMDFAVRNLRFEIEKDGILQEQTVVSYSAFPHFQWPKQETEIQMMQLSRTPDFSDAVRTVKTGDPQFVPETRLAAGKWYWRYAMRNAPADRWSDIQCIGITDPAHDFRLPEIDLENLKGKPHPRFASLVRSGAAVFADSFSKTFENPLPADPEPFQKSKLSKIEWLGQIGEEVVAKTGDRLKNMGDYLLVTDDQTVKDEARKRLFEAINWDVQGASNRKADDLSAAKFTLGICRLFDALYNDLTPVEREQVMDNIETRCEQFAEGGVIPFTLNPAQNHSFKKSETVGVCAMTLLGHRERAGYWFKAVCSIYAYRILPSMGFEGENQEGISYWRFGGQMIADYADVLQAFCGINLYKHPWLEKTVCFPVYCAPPGGYAIGFADQHFYGNHYVRGPYTPFGADNYMERLTRKTGYPYGSWYLGKSISGVKKQRPPVDTEQSVYWRHIGWTIFNTCLPNGYENVAVGFHSGKYFAGHQHADQNSFVINAYGDKLAIDGGYYDWYGSPHFTNYAVHTVAHNTVLVNGKGQAWRKDGADGRIETFYSSIPYDYTAGDASDPEIYEGALKLFKRKLLFIKPDYVVIHDQLAAKEKPAEFNWLIHSHTGDPIPFVQSNRTFSIVRPPARLDGRFLFPENTEIKVEKSYTVMPSERRGNQRLADEYITPEWTLSGNAKTESGETDFLTVMRISRTGAAAPVFDAEPVETETALGAVLRDGNRSIQVLSRKSGKGNSPLNYKGLSTDADIACVELNAAGVLQRAFMGQGTRLTFNDKQIPAQTAVANTHFNTQEEWRFRHLEPVTLIKGLPPFDAYVMQMNDGSLYTCSTEINLSSNTVFMMDRSGISNPVYVHVNGEISLLPESGEFTVKAGPAFLTVSSRSDPAGARKEKQAQE